MTDDSMPREHLALTPTIDRQVRRWDHIARRLMRASEQKTAIYNTVPPLAERWDGTHPMLRARIDSPQEVEIVLDTYSWEYDELLSDMTLLASECLHHVRVALDYLAYQLVSLAGQTASQLRTQFPIAPDLPTFEKWETAWLPGIAQHHRAAVLAVQPFNGCAWSEILRDLSNRDKHRLPVDVVPTYRFSYDPKVVFADPLGEPDYLGYQPEDANLEFCFAASGGQRRKEITGTLAGIVIGAAELVNEFLPEYGQNPMTIERVRGEAGDASGTHLGHSTAETGYSES